MIYIYDLDLFIDEKQKIFQKQEELFFIYPKSLQEFFTEQKYQTHIFDIG